MKTLQILFAAALCAMFATSCGQSSALSPEQRAKEIHKIMEDAKRYRAMRRCKDQETLAWLAITSPDFDIPETWYYLDRITDPQWLEFVATNELASGKCPKFAWFALLGVDSLSEMKQTKASSAPLEQIEFVAAYIDPDQSYQDGQVDPELVRFALDSLPTDESLERVVARQLEIVAADEEQRSKTYSRDNRRKDCSVRLKLLLERILNMEDKRKASVLLARATNALCPPQQREFLGAFMDKAVVRHMKKNDMLKPFLLALAPELVYGAIKTVDSCMENRSDESEQHAFHELCVTVGLEHPNKDARIKAVPAMWKNARLFLCYRSTEEEVRKACGLDSEMCREFQEAMDCDPDFVNGLGPYWLSKAEAVVDHGQKLESGELRPLVDIEREMRFYGPKGRIDKMKEREKPALEDVIKKTDRVDFSDPNTGYELGYSMGKLIGLYRNMQKECDEELKKLDPFLGGNRPADVQGGTKARWESAEKWAREAATEYRNAKATFKAEEEKWLKQAKEMDL